MGRRKRGGRRSVQGSEPAADVRQGDLLAPADRTHGVDGVPHAEPPVETEAGEVAVPDERRSEREAAADAADLREPPPFERVSEPERRPVRFELVAEDTPEAERPPPAGERLARAKDLVQDGRIEDALALYRAILADNPGSIKARNNLGALFEALGQHALALEQFEAAAKQEPENVEVLTNLGSVLGSLGRYDEGEALLRRAVRLGPENVEARASLGILLFRKGLYEPAEIELGWACDEDPHNGVAFYYRGEALNRLGRFDEAMAALEHAVTLQPRNGKAFYTLGILYDRKHLPEEASLMYRKAREFLKA